MSIGGSDQTGQQTGTTNQRFTYNPNLQHLEQEFENEMYGDKAGQLQDPNAPTNASGGSPFVGKGQRAY